ncbi:hypothetical protein BJ878DRAFT_421762 [Calycina marina]|uniref:Carrier domain-containing protein n=1 Tax=Calycina marina TaxID=1763456 RepID=A0A9P8CGA5_9HELO|nr:hypothetical protein BJ878DRAFT_421762 [Calycina marina]
MAAKFSIINDPPQSLPGPRLLHDLLNFDTQRQSCAIDFTIDGRRETYSYEEVRTCADDLARRIQGTLSKSAKLNKASQHVVPILLPQSPGLYTSQLAILKSGGAFCPINLDSPKERIKFVVGDVAASVIITTAEFQELVTWEGGPDIIVVDEFPKSSGDEGFAYTPREVQHSDLAYVMYTSGSSGKPKGVAVSHRAASQSLLAHERYIPGFERFLQFAAPSFDVSIFEIFFPLTRGATLVGCGRTQLLNDLPGTINSLEVDAVELTPTVIGALLQKRSNVPNLKLLITIGEMLTRPIVEEFGGSESKKSILYGMYGPTEAAIHCTIHPNMDAFAKPSNIGIPLDTVSTFVAAPASADEHNYLEILPLGGIGELVLGGPQLASGYLNRPDQNKAAFITSQGKQYYRTGDKARFLEDGTIEVMGRMTAGQIKLRGQRVELGEIEDAIYKHPGIKTVTATVLGNTLLAFALSDDSRLGAQDVSDTCAKWLPEFMRPHEIVILQRFPYLPSGKVDKRKLESDFQQQQSGENEAEVALTAVECTVKSILVPILGSFSSAQPLVSVGLDSLSSIRVASALRSSGFEVSTLAVLKAETLTELSKLCELSPSVNAEPTSRVTTIDIIEYLGLLNGNAEDVDFVAPCTPLQVAMLSETLLDKKAYRNWIELEIRGCWGFEQLLSALYHLASINPILRSGFVESQDSAGFIQVTWKSLADTQFEDVAHFNYDYSESKDSSLRYPIRCQIRQCERSAKLLFHLHHALYDAWSLELLLDDLDQILEGKETNPRPAFSVISDSCANGVLDADSWASKDYWKDHLAALDPRRLPNFHSQKQVIRGLVPLTYRTALSTEEVQKAAKNLLSSPQAIFQAAYAMVLSSYLGATDICFGTVFSGRTLPIEGIENIAGPCLSTLPIRVDVSTSTTLQGLVQDLNFINRKHLEYSAVPLREIKSASGIPADQVLFDTLLIWQQTLHGYEHTRDHVVLVDTTDHLEFRLTLEIIPGTGSIVLKANYETSMFPESQIMLLLQQVEQLARRVIEDAVEPIKNAFQTMSDELMSIGNETPAIQLGLETLVSPVERIAEQDPGQIAICFANKIDGEHADVQRISYAELNTRSNKLSNYLRSHQILPDELVCICMDKCVDLYISILAVTKVGAGYLPATADTPIERLRHILTESKVRTVLAQSASRPLLETFTYLKIVYIDEIDLEAIADRNPLPAFSTNFVSYCIYTSGSTGTPKGVLVTQGNLLSNLDTLEELYPATKNWRLLQSCSQAFDVSVFEIFYIWRIGACICSAEKDVLFKDIENSIRVLGVTHLSLTPTVAALVHPENVPNVKFLVTAGEAVTQKVFNLWADHGLYQGYGPSETTNICTVRPRVSQQDFINNIGPPLKNTSVFVLSPGPEFSMVIRGGEGEFCFGGSQVFRGYIDPSQDVGKIVQHPKYGRLYRSGDYGRLMPDGSLAFTGRKDDQVKVRGQRVELGEINRVMLQLVEIKDCLTIVISLDGSAQRLVAFWTRSSKASGIPEFLTPDAPMVSRIHETLESSLPAYMIPATLIEISFLPATAQGKIDKRTLERRFNELSAEYLTAATRSSSALDTHVWSDVELEIAKNLGQLLSLKRDNIGIDTSFFSLGLDSISAITFARLLRKSTGKPLEISDVLRNSSVLRLANRLSSFAHVPEIERTDQAVDFGFNNFFLETITERFLEAGKAVQHILPCTPLQEAMLSAAEASSGQAYYNHVTFQVEVDLARFKECWQAMVERHEILRTCFINTDMASHPYVQVVLQHHDLELSSSDRNDIADDHNKFEPPYNLDILEAAGSVSLTVSMHHCMYDGVALSVLYEEVEDMMKGKPLPPPVSFAPFLKRMASNQFQDSTQFWDATLGNFTPSRLTSIHVDPHSSHSTKPQVGVQRKALSIPLSQIQESSRKHDMTLLVVLHTVWASLLSDLLGQTDVCFGNVVSGRTLQLADIERLVAPCFNTLPSRLQNIHRQTFLEAFRHFQTLNANSLSHHMTPLRRLQSKYSPDGMRLFDTLFILQQPARSLDASIWTIVEDDGSMDFPLVCEILPKHSDDALEIILHSHSSYITPQQSDEIINMFDLRLRAAVQNPRQQLLSSDVKTRIATELATRQKQIHGETRTSIGNISPVEKGVKALIAEYTDVPIEKIGRDVSIFRLGLDSITTVQVVTRLKKKGHHVKPSDILEHPTVSQFAAFLEAQTTDISSVAKLYDTRAFDVKYRDAIFARLDIVKEQVEIIRPCTAVQQGMIAQSLHSRGENYINSVWLKLDQGTSIPNLRLAWIKTVAVHEMLRTGFTQVEDPQHPFAMITYTEKNRSLPWSNEPSDSINGSFLDSLHTHCWRITVGSQGESTVLRFTAHHALYDSQSMQMIFQDVVRAYNGHEPTQRPLITPLIGHILEEAKDSPEQQEFWKGEENKIVINRFPDLTPLRVSSERTLVTVIASTYSLSQLEEHCRAVGVTMQAAGQATWARILAAYTGEVSTTFGVTLSGRSLHEDADSVAFPTIVTLPVRSDVTGTNEELLARTMTHSAGLSKHQFTPLTSIQKWSGHQEGKLFDTLFAYQKLPETFDEVKLPWQVIKEEASVDYTVSLEVQPTGSGQVALRLTFNENSIPTEQAELILKQFDALFLDTICNPGNACDSAPRGQSSLLSISPAKESVLPVSDTLLHHYVVSGARKWPARVAFEFATSLEPGNVVSQTWTYQQLDEESNKVANMLLYHGVIPGQMVAICFDKCPEASFAIIGVLKSGCSYVALDPTAPTERLDFILKDSDAKHILTASKAAENFSSSNLQVTDLSAPSSFHDYPPSSPVLSRQILPDDVSYCLYTSGTTGTPKGCLITHENAVQAMLSFQRLFAGHWTQDSKWLQFASFHFDVSVLELFWSWSAGIRVVSAPRDLIFEDIASAIRELRITHIDLTPSLARLITPEDVPSLCEGVFITGGEQLRQDILDAWENEGCIYNGYGPTEATIGCTMFPRVPQNGKPSNIGPQFDNVGSYVMKPGTEVPVLRGGIGELCVSGKLVGKGYLNRPELTTERFPNLKEFGEKVYRTGDLVRILHDGTFIFHGREDDQIKLRGQRLELSEINEVMKKSTAKVQEVVTLVLKHKSQQKEQLVAYIVPHGALGDEEMAILLSSLREACKTRLSGYMVPTHFVPIDALPLNPNNKADARELASIYNEISVEELHNLSHSKHEKLWNAEEKHVLDIVASAIGIECSALTQESNVFELGLDSISIIGFSRHLQESGLTRAKLAVVKDNPSIGALVKCLLNEAITTLDAENAYLAASQYIAAFSQRHMTAICQELRIDSSGIESIAPCTPMQEGMIYQFLASDTPLYFNTFKFRIDDDIDLPKLMSAWYMICRRLQVSRTRFVLTDNGYAQVVVSQWNHIVHYQPLNHSSMEKSAALKAPFALTETRERAVMLEIFHGLYDGNSLTMLLRHVISELRGNHYDLGPAFHLALAHGPLLVHPGAQRFWTQHLRRWSHCPLKTQHDRGKDVIASRTVTDLSGFEPLRKQLGVTPQSLVQAAWLSILQPLCSSNITIGVITSGRAIDFEGADKVVGPMFNTVPFNVRIKPKMTAASLTIACHRFNMAMQDFQHTPLKDIQKWSPASPGQSLFETLFVYQREELGDDTYADCLWTQEDVAPHAEVSVYPSCFQKFPRTVEWVLPATPLQQSMVSEMLRSNYERYFNVEGFKLSKDVDHQKLRRAINHVYTTSPILWSEFDDIPDPKLAVSFAQVARRKPLHVTESRESTDPAIFLASYRRRAIKHTPNRLFQVHFVIDQETVHLLIAMSHALYDGASLRLLHQNIKQVYHQKPVQHPDLRPFLEEVFESTTEDAKTFWKNTLANLPTTRLFSNTIVEGDQSTTVHRLDKFSRIPLADIEGLCRSQRITLQTLGQTCWSLVLASLMGQLDVVFGTVLSCRDSEEANAVLFPLMNTVAVRSVIHGTLGAMLKYMQEMSDATRQYQHFPLGIAQAYALASRSSSSETSETSLFDTLFIFQGRRSSAEAEDELYTSIGGLSEVDYPICVEMEVVDDRLIWTTACKSSARTKQETCDLLNTLDRVLERVIAAPEDSTIVAGTQGISVCGLSSFETTSAITKLEKAIPPAKSRVDPKWSTTEISIRKALHELSGVPESDIRKSSTIFHLGLDSILILKLPPLLKTYGILLRVSDIMKAQTIASMATLRNSKEASAPVLDIEGIIATTSQHFDINAVVNELKLGEIEYYMPVTAGQLYMIRMWQGTRGALFYPTFTYSLNIPLDGAKMKKAWKQLTTRHDILRTGFFETESSVVQVVFKDPPNEIQYQSNAEDNATNDHIAELRKPPVSLVIEETKDQGTVIKLSIHHTLYDGVSLPIVIDELEALYLGKTLATSDTNFKAFVAQTLLASGLGNTSSKSSAKQRWIDYLGNSDTTQASSASTNESKRMKRHTPHLLIHSLRSVAQSVGVSIDALLLAAICKTRAELLSTTDVTIGIYLANRTLAPRLAAPTLNLLPLRVRDARTRSTRDIAIAIQHDLQLIGALEMNSVSLAEIYEYLGVKVDFFVNILKDASNSSVSGVSSERVFIPMKQKAFQSQTPLPGNDVQVNRVEDERFAAYIVSSRHGFYTVDRI